MKKFAISAMCICCVGVCSAAKTWVLPEAAVKAKFVTTKIGVTKGENFHYLQGKISVSYKSVLKYFKKPVLRVVVLTEENGTRAVRDTILDEPNLKIVGDRESDGSYWCSHWWSDNWVTKTTTMPEHWDSDDIGKNVPDSRCRTIAEISSNQVDVAKASYASTTYLGLPLDVQVRHGIKGIRYQTMFGYCRFAWNESAKMLGYRLEAWQDGQCIAYWDSVSDSDIKKYEIPEDWHVSFAHQDKLQYRSPWAAKKIVRQ